MLHRPQNHGKVFISYRREGGGEMARLIMNELRQRGYEVFMDVEDLRSGAFNQGLLAEMKTATDVVVILSPQSLERCQNEGDWLRREIAYALKAQKNIVPVMMRDFEWPAQPLPPDIHNLRFQNALAPTHEMFQASMERLTTFLIARRKPVQKGRRAWLGIAMAGGSTGCLLLLTVLYFMGVFSSPALRPAQDAAAVATPAAAGLPSAGTGAATAPEAGRSRDHPKEMQIELGPGVKLELVWVPGGTFLMGDDASPRKEEKPACLVRVKGFWMGKYEVTQKQYQRIMGEKRGTWRGEQHPVDGCGWEGAQEFCRRATELTGHKISLPSEAQWEYACRAGSTARYCCGDDLVKALEYGWFKENIPPGTHTQDVGLKKPNAFGLYDMHGNVQEICADQWRDHYFGQVDDKPYLFPSPRYPGANQNRTMRGGAFANPVADGRSTRRVLIWMGLHGNQDGFRVMSPEE